MKKYKQVKVNLTINDYQSLSKKVKLEKSKSMADYVRKRLNLKIENSRSSTRVMVNSLSQVDLRLLYEINKIGTNLNQIARYVNTHKSIDRAVLTELVEIEYSLKDLL